MLDHLIKRIVPLVLTFWLSVLFTAGLQAFTKAELTPLADRNRSPELVPPSKLSQGPGWGTSGSSPGASAGEAPSRTNSVTAPYRITFQPKAFYTDAARENNIQGSVRLKITLLASGHIGSVTAVTELPDGLTEQAIAAAKKIKFEPKTVNGIPISVVVTREYTFTIY